MSTCSMSRRGRSLLSWLSLPLLIVWAGTAFGVDNIRNVDWVYDPGIAWSPESTPAHLTFDAEITALEVMFPVTSFSIALLYPESSPRLLYRYACGPLAGVPAGTPARFTLLLSFRCDPVHGDIEVENVMVSMRFLDPTIGEKYGSVEVERLTANASVRETLGIALLDQEGNIISQSLPSDTFACTTENDNGALGVYFDPEGSSCQGTIPAGTVGKVYILATLSGATVGGLAGAEFRFTGLPGAWEAFAVPSPDLLALGDPFGDGVVTGFPCKPSHGGKVLLYTVAVNAHADVTDVRFDLGMRTPPLNFPCPLVVACDAPAFTKYCVETSPCFINATSTTPCSSSVAVQQVTWSTMKELYR